MATPMRKLIAASLFRISPRFPRLNCAYSNDNNKLEDNSNSPHIKTDIATAGVKGETSGFVKAMSILDERMDKVARIIEETEFRRRNNTEKSSDVEEELSFEQLLYASPIVKLGDPVNAKVIGEIVKRVSDDLYIDFGAKFHCVCKVPKDGVVQQQQRNVIKQRQNHKYIPGAKVIVLIKDLEMTSRFMGYNKDMTLLEADAKLLGLLGETDEIVDKSSSRNRHSRSGR